MASSDETYFSHTSGGFCLHSQKEGDTIPGCRFVLARFGEDIQKVIDAFWSEQASQDFQIVPLFAY